MVEAIVGALLEKAGDSIEGLWLKGSAAKSWDTPIDYVPEISDVDIHYRVADTKSFLRELDDAIQMHVEIARRFRSLQPSPVHVPRPQFISVSQIEQSPDYIPSPPATIKTLYGASPPAVSNLDQHFVRVVDQQNLLKSADPEFLNKAIADLVERPGHHLYPALRPLNWRVSPTGSRALSVLGVDYSTAWSANRTNTVEMLRLHDQEELADQFSAYYSSAWEFFLSNWQDEDAGRAAFAAGVMVLRLSAEVAARSSP
jgi:hypothetical protein